MSGPQSSVCKVICKIPLETLWKSQSLDISECGTPERYRLMSCADFIYAENLSIHEYDKFPESAFAAISYVWKGNTPGDFFDKRVFNVPVPQDPGDPIGIEVLHDACVAALACGATHLWLDRICIMQMSEKDKRWQIQRMYEIYQRCSICIVVPGGIQCLVGLDEETQWIHRGWTLQEVVAPRPESVYVLFSWRLGKRRAWAGDVDGNIVEVTPLKSAMTSLSLIVDASTTGRISIVNDGSENRLPVEVKLFSSHAADRTYRDFPFWRETRRVLAPNVGALARAMSVDLDEDAKYHSIWQSALMRTSSRPVDMVFSIMGLFGVSLNPSDFGKGDRVRATIALAQAIMKKGGRATWLAAALHISPSQQISTFPKFPRTTVSGKAFVKMSGGLREVSLMMENEYPVAAALVPMPTGSMDDEGYITFTAKATRVQFLPDRPAELSSEHARPAHVQATDKSWWEIQQDTDGAEGEAFAVLVGYFVSYYPGATPAHDTKNIRAMIVEKHAYERFHVRSYLMLSRDAKAWAQAWPERTFSIGGPALKVVEDLGEELPVICVPREQYFNNPQSSHYRAAPTLEDRVIRQSRWAIPPKVLEQEYAKLR